MTHSDVAYEDANHDTALLAGTSLCDGQFTLTHQIGAGGFGLTYKAEDNILGRTVVIKECFPEDFCMRHGINVVPRNQQHGQQFQSIVSMFMHEARSLAKLRHPNIVGVHRAFEENNTAYMVLDLIEGEDLLDIVDKKAHALTPEIVEDLLLKILDAVEKVHDMDLLHRDIAPDNIMIDKAGTPILIDFGAARGDASRKTRLISSLLVVKDGYSPQEFYVAGSAQSPSSDLFALGATFYHLLTGEAPLNSQARMVEIAGGNEDPCKPLAQRVKGYQHAFLDAIDQAMKIMPADRLQSAGEWRDLLTAATNSNQQPNRQRLSPDQSATPRQNNAADLSQSLTKLIEETNVVVSKIPAVEEQPKVVETPKAVSKIPEWVEEFNRETAGKDVADTAPTLAVEPEPTELAPVQTQTAKRARTSRPTQPKQTKTRIVQSTTSGEDRPTGWALNAIQQRDNVRAANAKSIAINVDVPPADSDQLLRDSMPPVSPEAQDGWLKPVVRMGLMGAFFGILVAIGATVVLNGGA